jgi:hypothetical protein
MFQSKNFKNISSALAVLIIVIIPISSKAFAATVGTTEQTCDVVSDQTDFVQETNANAVPAQESILWTHTIPGATWIWKTAVVADPMSMDTSTFTKTFNLTNIPISATFEIAADDGYDISINGTELASNDGMNNLNFTQETTYDATSLLVPGDNTLKITGTNIGFPNTNAIQNPAGILYRLHVQGSDCGTVTGGGSAGGSTSTGTSGGGSGGIPFPVFGTSGGTSGGSTSGGSGNGQVLGASTGPVGQVLGASIDCGEIIPSYVQLGQDNDVQTVTNLQAFLNGFMQSGLTIDGVYGAKTVAAVDAFQTKQSNDVLLPWKNLGNPNLVPTGYVYKTTKREINNLACPALNLPIPMLP